MVWQSEEHIQEAVGTSTRVSSKKHPPPQTIRDCTGYEAGIPSVPLQESLRFGLTEPVSLGMLDEREIGRLGSRSYSGIQATGLWPHASLCLGFST